MFEKVFEYESDGHAAIIPLSHGDAGSPSGHEHLFDGAAEGGPPDHGHHQMDSSSDGLMAFAHRHLIDGAEASGASGHGRGPTASSSSLSSSSSTSDQTLVGTAGGLQIDLQWDSSVADAPSGFKAAVIQAATNLADLFSTHEVINIDVGWGEAAGSSLSSNTLGENESNGYLTNYATVAAVVHAPAAGNEPSTSQFFVSSAEAKSLGMVSATSSAVDGYVGFGTLSGTGYSWDYDTSTSPIGANQFDLQAAVQHEMSEVMGRIGLEGQTINGTPTYTPLDLFNFSSPNVLELSAHGGYFSNDGATNLGTFNDASLYGGDVGDWASAISTTESGTQGLTTGNYYDAFDAFAAPGNIGQVTSSDVSEMAVLGYALRTV